MEIEGIVYSVLSPVEGVSSRGSAWKKQEVVIETLEGEFSRKVCITFFGDKAEESAKLTKGEKVRIGINIESREYNGRWFTNVNAWRVEREQPAQTESVPPLSSYSAEEFVPSGDVEDDLPF